MSETIDGHLRRKFKPWQVPNFVSVEGEVEGVPVGQLSAATLNALAEAWLDGLYSKAGAANPWKRSATR